MVSKKKPIALIKHSDGETWSTPDGRYNVRRTYGRAYTRGPFRAYYDLSHKGALIKLGIPTLKEVREQIEKHMAPKAGATSKRSNPE